MTRTKERSRKSRVIRDKGPVLKKDADLENAYLETFEFLSRPIKDILLDTSDDLGKSNQAHDFLGDIFIHTYYLLEFQLLDITDEGHKEQQDRKEVFGHNGPWIRLFGSTRSGRTVQIMINDFYPYFYFPVTSLFTQDDIPQFKAIATKILPKLEFKEIKLVEREPIMFCRVGYGNTYSHFLKIMMKEPRFVSSLAKILNNADTNNFSVYYTGEKLYTNQCYESNLMLYLRFMIDLGLVGCGWIQIPSGTYRQLKVNHDYHNMEKDLIENSKCELNIYCQYQHLVALNPKVDDTDDRAKQLSSNAPLRTLAMQVFLCDRKIAFIACLYRFPESDENQWIVLYHGPKIPVQEKAYLKTYAFKDEMHLLLGFRNMFLVFDPDIVTGYNLMGQFSDILDRSEAFNLSFYPYFGRIGDVSTKRVSRQLYCHGWVRIHGMAQSSNRALADLNMDGRLLFDMRQIIEREKSLRTYSFAEAVQEYFNHPKETLDEITFRTLMNGSDMDRNRLLNYSLKDVTLAYELFTTSATFYTFIELSRVTGLPLMDLLNKGQMIRFWSQLFRHAIRRQVVIPTIYYNETSMVEGSLNLMPEVGYNTKDVIVILDFASLYPSIMISKNLCYSTLLPNEDKHRLSEDDYIRSPIVNETLFVKSHVNTQLRKHSIISVF
jgi:DNA polymerase delta subunit 1